MAKTIIANCVWMARYEGEGEVFGGGYDFVKRHGYGHELFNFMDVGGKTYGFVQNKGDTINIDRLGASKGESFVDGVTVLWTAPHPEKRTRVLVGWYRTARLRRQCDHGRIEGRVRKGESISFNIEAPTAECHCLPVTQRDLFLPSRERGKKGVPGQASVFYVDQAAHPEILAWVDAAKARMESVMAKDGGEGGGVNGGKGWGRRPDATHNALVEAAAVKRVRQHYGMEGTDRQKDNCGWDLEFAAADGCRCVEVKGTSGAEACAELTPNEYKAMSLAEEGRFGSGRYLLAIVTEALSEQPILHLFEHAKGDDWVCSLTGKVVRRRKRTGASLRSALS